MMHFFQNFRLYVTLEALEPAWLTLEARVREATTLDQAGCHQPRACVVPVIVQCMPAWMHAACMHAGHAFPTGMLYFPPIERQSQLSLLYRLTTSLACTRPQGIPCRRCTRFACCPSQVMRAHEEWLRRVMKGCLLSRKVKVLRALMELKTAAHRFSSASGRLAPKQDAERTASLDPVTGATLFPSIYPPGICTRSRRLKIQHNPVPLY